MSKEKPKNEHEVAEYISEHGFMVDAGEFFDHMEMVGWVYGKKRHPVKDWRACVRTWHRFAVKRANQEGGLRL